MVEVWTTPFTAVTSTVISSSDFNAGVKGNLNYIRQFLSANPANTNMVLLSTGANGAGWSTLPDAALALPKVQASTTITTSFTSLVAAARNGFHEVSPATDGPSGITSTWYCLNVVEQNVPGTYAAQFAMKIDDQNELWFHEVIAGSAGAWVRIWHSGNDGSGSGMDAGLLEGHAASFFATAASVTSEAATRAAADAAINQVPSGLGGFFTTAAGIASGWTRYTNGDGRLLVGAGTTFSVTYTENTAVGANWTPFAGAAVSSGTAADVTLFDTTPAVTAASAPSHTHLVTFPSQTWTPVARIVVWATKN